MTAKKAVESWNCGARNGTSVGVEPLTTGFTRADGPVWDAARSRLIFADSELSAVYTWDPRRHNTVFRAPSRKTSRCALDGEGRLLRCEQETSRLVRDEEDGATTVLAPSEDGRMGALGDVTVATDASVWFTAIAGRVTGNGAAESVSGVYRLCPSGELIHWTDMANPSGLCLAPDESHLYVVDALTREIRRVEASEPDEGSAIAVVPTEHGRPAGVRVDSSGRVFVACWSGVWVCTAEGEFVDRLLAPEKISGLAWGGDDLCTLFLTGATTVYYCRTAIPGAR